MNDTYFASSRLALDIERYMEARTFVTPQRLALDVERAYWDAVEVGMPYGLRPEFERAHATARAKQAN